MGASLVATDYGRKKNFAGLIPITSFLPLTPEKMLKLIS